LFIEVGKLFFEVLVGFSPELLARLAEVLVGFLRALLGERR